MQMPMILTFYQQNMCICNIHEIFYELLTNDVVNFEQLGPSVSYGTFEFSNMSNIKQTYLDLANT